MNLPRRVRTIACALCLLPLVAGTAGARKKAKKKDAGPSPTAVAIRGVLDAQGDKISQCVIDAAPDEKWAWRVSAALMVNDLGQVMGCTVTVDPTTPASSKARSCVEKVLRSAPFPKTHDSLTQINRSWAFSSQ